MTVITLGPEGTFSHELALRLKCEPIILEPTIHSIFAAVAAGGAMVSSLSRTRRQEGWARPLTA